MLDRAYHRSTRPFSSRHGSKSHGAGRHRVIVKSVQPRKKGSSPARPAHRLGQTKQSLPWESDIWQHRQQEDHKHGSNENRDISMRRDGGDTQSQLENDSNVGTTVIANAGRSGRGRDGEGNEHSTFGGIEASAGQRSGSTSALASAGVVTVESILESCGKSLIESSAVSAPLDFLTSEAEYRKVWKVFTAWLCSAVSAKLRAYLPNFFSLSYRVFNLGICIPTLELDSRFLERYGLTQEQSLSSKSSLSPRAPHQVTFSKETLGKEAGLPPARATFALEGILCAAGKEAGRGRTLLVDCGVGVLAARGRVMKFTFVQGADSLEVVHKYTPREVAAPRIHGGRAGEARRGGIHAFGKCYIPYTSRGNKELADARTRETEYLLRAESMRNAGGTPPDGVEGEEGMQDNGVIEAMRSWDPAGVPCKVSGSAGVSMRPQRMSTQRDLRGGEMDAAKDEDGDSSHAGSPACTPRESLLQQLGSAQPPPPLIDIHARLRGSILSSPRRPTPVIKAVGELADSEGTGDGSDVDGAALGWPLGLEPRGVERLGNHYSPAAQVLFLDRDRGCIAWRDYGQVGTGSRTPRGNVLCRLSDESPYPPEGLLGRITEAPQGLPRALLSDINDCGPESATAERTGGDAPAIYSPAATGGNAKRNNNSGGAQSPPPSSSLPLPLRSPNSQRRPTFACKRLVRDVSIAATIIPISSFASPRSNNAAGNDKEDEGGGDAGDSVVVHQDDVLLTPLSGDKYDKEIMSGFERYRYYIEHDPLLSQSVLTLQPGVVAGILRKGMEGLLAHSDNCNDSVSGCDRLGGLCDLKSSQNPSSCRETLWFEDSDSECSGSSHTRPNQRTQQTQPRGSAGAGGVPAAVVGESEEDLESKDGDQFDANGPSPPPRLATAATIRGYSFAVGGAGLAGSRSGTQDLPGKFQMPAFGRDDRTPGEEVAVTDSIADLARLTAVNGGAGKTRVTATTGAAAVGVACAWTPRRARASRPELSLTEMEIPDVLRAGVSQCLDEACVAFCRSVRRAVLNYVLLDAGQRHRLAIPQIPTRFRSEGWGWGQGQGFRESPPEWRRRFCRAREALSGGQITGSPALLAAQALLVESRGVRLLKLPISAAARRVTRWPPLTPEEFRNSQLNRLAKTAGKVRRLLYPGLSEALTWGLGNSAPRQDGHVRRYLLAVNVMTASVLRRLVEMALTELQAFFELYSDAAASDRQKGGVKVIPPSDDDDISTSSTRSESRSGGDNGGNGNSSSSEGDDRESAKSSPASFCPPAFKIFLEESPATPRMPSELTCEHSMATLREAVMDVVRGVVMCFQRVPRVVYDCADKAEDLSFSTRNSGRTSGDSGGDANEEKSPTSKVTTNKEVPQQLLGPSKRISLYTDSEDESSDEGEEDDDSSCNTVEEFTKSFESFDEEHPATSGTGGRGCTERRGVYLAVLKPTEAVVIKTVKAISSCLRTGATAAADACKVYEPFCSLLKEADKVKLRPDDVPEKELPHLAKAIHRYEATAAILRSAGNAAPIVIPGRLLVVDCEETSRKLLGIAEELSKGALQWVTLTLGRLTGDITKQARTAILKLGKRPRSTAEMAEAIEYLRSTRAQEQVELRQRQLWMGQLLDFIFKHGGLQHEIVVSVSGVHRVMVELATATEKAIKAIAEGQAQLQKAVEKARRRVEDEVESVQVRIAAFVEGGGRARDMSEKATAIVKDLEGLRDQAVQLGEEETKVDGFASGALVASTEKVLLQFKPYADVWTLAFSVGPFVTSTMRSFVNSLDPDQVTAEHSSMKSRLQDLYNVMSLKSQLEPARAAQDALRQLSALEKDIPVMKGLSNPRLKDRHWQKFSTLAGVTVSKEHPMSLQQLNELDVLTDAKVETILRLSQEADAEDALETETAEANIFVREVAVLRVKVESHNTWGDDDDGCMDGGQKEDVVSISRVDEEHLKEILEQAESHRKRVKEVKLAETSKAAAATEELPDSWLTKIIDDLEITLTALTKAGEAILKCAQLIPDIQMEIDEHTGGDDGDHEGVLKVAIEKWQSFLVAHSGQSLKDLLDSAEEALLQLNEVSEG